MTKLLAVFFLCSIVFISCKKDDKDDPIENFDFTGVLVGNEGQFQVGNGEVDFYNPSSKEVKNRIFKARNKRPLGDVMQAFVRSNDRIYLIVNNSKKIEVVNRKDFSSLGVIENLNSPKNMLPLSGNKAYVTNLFGSTVDIVNTATFSKTGSINIGGGGDRMLLYNDKVIVGNTSDSFLYFINTSTDMKVDSLKSGRAPSEFILDNNNRLWVLCKGFYNSGTQLMEGLGIYVYDITTKNLIKKYDFAAGASPSYMALNKAKDKIYFLNGSVYSVNVNDGTITPQKFNTDNVYYYGFGLDPDNDDIYVANPKDYTQNGFVKRYKVDGTQLDSFAVSVAPSSFFFNY